ncbi:hypothetical protein BSL78_27104 [Apostichopus japonicus]|uniref:BRICHOS domain-containing protein n=1 Tax=Stichopus japonicus TaxID=307972 RepID=A0A2G8JK10_STIJA|nr:hypothetical protein BSL78_27104 [Apostichopus japonicus]
MAQEMQVKGDIPVAMSPPPAYTYQQPSKTKLYVIAVTVTIVTLLVLSFGVFYLVFSGNPKVVNNLTTGDGDQVVIIREVAFEMFDGVPRNEKMMVEGNILIIENLNDGYTATFDHDKNIIMIKDLKNNNCYFTPLEDYPGDMSVDNLDNILPFFFREADSSSDKVRKISISLRRGSGRRAWWVERQRACEREIGGERGGGRERFRVLNHSNARMYAEQLEPIPAGFLKLINAADQCIDSLSFWIEPMNNQDTRIVRAAVRQQANVEPVVPCELWVVVTDCETYFITVC